MSLKKRLIIRGLKGKYPLWVYRLIGRRLARKIGLTEEEKMADGQTGDVKQKPWYLSKAKVAAIVTVIVGAIGPISEAFGHPVKVPPFVIEILIGLGIYGVRDAIKN